MGALYWIGVVLVLVVFVVVVVLARPIFWPSQITYPWQLPNSTKQRLRDKEKIVILAGSYNPPHYGHLAMLEYLASRYRDVICVIGMNPKKKYPVSPQERASLLRRMIQETLPQSNIRVEVVTGYIWRFAKKQGATIFFRGIRSWDRDGAEERHLLILNTWGPLLYGPLVWPVPTIYLHGKPEYNDISSTLIRDLCHQRYGGRNDFSTLENLVPSSVVAEVTQLYSRE